MKEHVTFEASPIAVLARLLDQLLDTAVDSFGVCITEVMVKIGHDIIPVAFEHPRYFLDRFQTGGYGFVIPLPEELRRIISIRTCPERAQQLFHLPRSGRFGRDLP